MIHCTACRYCTDGCPKHILIPDIFACYNQKKIFNNWNQNYYYKNVLTSKNGKASECVKCGVCEKACPQSLKIRNLLKIVAYEFEEQIRDVSTSDPTYVYAKWAIENQITYLNKGFFNPYGSVRKIDIIVFLYRFYGRPKVDKNNNVLVVRDIKKYSPFICAILWSLNKTITFTDADNNYYPDKKVTNLDCVVYIWRMLGRPQPKNDLLITDMMENKFLPAVQWFAEKCPNVIHSDGKFHPYESINRITAFRNLYFFREMA